MGSYSIALLISFVKSLLPPPFFPRPGDARENRIAIAAIIFVGAVAWITAITIVIADKAHLPKLIMCVFASFYESRTSIYFRKHWSFVNTRTEIESVVTKDAIWFICSNLRPNEWLLVSTNLIFFVQLLTSLTLIKSNFTSCIRIFCV